MRHNSARTQRVSGEMRGLPWSRAHLWLCPLTPHPWQILLQSTQVSAHPDLRDLPPAAGPQHISGSRAASSDRLQPLRGNAGQESSVLSSHAREAFALQERSSEEVWSTHRFSEAAVWFRLFILALVQSHRPSAQKGSKSSCRHASGLFAI